MILAEVLEVQERALPPDPTMSNTENWDSYNALVFVSEVEGVFGVKINTADVLMIKSLADMKAVLERKGIITD